jgi:hypothetical protein
MIDVHPPTEAAHTWKDFFIHIATIVVGLLIALSLEQTVEHFHHRAEIAELRNSLAEERDHNREVYHRATEVYLQDAAMLHNNLRVFMYLRDHPKTPEAELPGVVLWPRHTYEPSTSAWNDSGQSSVLAMMPREEVNKYSSTYFNLQRTLDGYNAMAVSLANAAAIVSQTSNPTTLSPKRIDDEIELIERANAMHMLFGLWLQGLSRDQPDFTPAFPNDLVFAFTDFPQEDKQRADFPQAYSFTQKDLEEARRLMPTGSSDLPASSTTPTH